MYQIRKVYKFDDEAVDSYPLDHLEDAPKGAEPVGYGVYYTKKDKTQEHLHDFETLEEAVIYLQDAYEDNRPDAVELLEAYHHWLYYRDFKDFNTEVIAAHEGQHMADHLDEKFRWYYGMKGVIKAEVEWVQYNFIRSPQRWRRFVKYLREKHWNKW